MHLYRMYGWQIKMALSSLKIKPVWMNKSSRALTLWAIKCRMVGQNKHGGLDLDSNVWAYKSCTTSHNSLCMQITQRQPCNNMEVNVEKENWLWRNACFIFWLMLIQPVAPHFSKQRDMFYHCQHLMTLNPWSWKGQQSWAYSHPNCPQF